MNQTCPRRHRVVPQHQIQEVHRGLYRRPGSPVAEALPRLCRLYGVQNHDVDLIVTGLASHRLGRVGALRAEHSGRVRPFGRHSARADLHSALECTADGLIQEARTVPASPDPVGSTSRFAEQTLEVAVLQGQNDAVVLRTLKPSGPHHVAVAAVLEHAPFGDQNPPVDPLQFKPLRVGSDQLVIDDDGRSGRAGGGASVVSGGSEARELLTLSTGSNQQRKKTWQQAATRRTGAPGPASTHRELQWKHMYPLLLGTVYPASSAVPCAARLSRRRTRVAERIVAAGTLVARPAPANHPCARHSGAGMARQRTRSDPRPDRTEAASPTTSTARPSGSRNRRAASRISAAVTARSRSRYTVQ